MAEDTQIRKQDFVIKINEDYLGAPINNSNTKPSSLGTGSSASPKKAQPLAEDMRNFLLTENDVLEWLGPNGDDAKIPLSHRKRKNIIQDLVTSKQAFSVCLIITPTQRGTGFHLGNGWVVTNSHVLDSRAAVERSTFKFTTKEGKALIFKPHPRFGFRYRINVKDPFGIKVPDLAMVKLGIQSTYAGVHKPAQWEIDEEDLLRNFKLPSLVRDFKYNVELEETENGVEEILTPLFTHPRVGEQANSIHFGPPTPPDDPSHYDPCKWKQYACTDNAIQRVWPLENSSVVIFEHRGVARDGSSGSPVFDDKGIPIGVSFTSADKDFHRSCALCWETEMYKLQQLGLKILPDVETIQAYQKRAPRISEKIRKELQQLAQDKHVDVFV